MRRFIRMPHAALAGALCATALVFLSSLAHARGETVPPCLQLPTEEERAALGGLQKHSRAVFALRHPRGTVVGTAFCIDRDRRLLATAGHCVLDGQFSSAVTAVMGSTDRAYRIQRMWVHPEARLNRTSQRAADGTIRFTSVNSEADVAILQLNDGPPLPEEFRLAPPATLPGWKGHAVAMLGFPGYAPEAPALTCGVVYDLSHRNDTELPWGLEHNAASWSSMSGAPVLTRDRLVVGIQSASGFLYLDGSSVYRRSIATGVTALRDLLSNAAGLEGAAVSLWDTPPQPAVAPLPFNRPHAAPLPDDARRLLEEARALTEDGKYAEAVERCGKAAEITTSCWPVHTTRGNAYLLHAKSLGRTDREHRRYARLAHADLIRAYHLHPTSPWQTTDLLHSLTELGLVENRGYAWHAEHVSREHLTRPLPLDVERMFRCALVDALLVQRKFSDALAAANTAIEHAPEYPHFYTRRAIAHDWLRSPALAQADRATHTRLTAAAAPAASSPDTAARTARAEPH